MFTTTTATKKIRAMRKRIRALPGGTSAAKTVSVILCLIDLAQTDTVPTLTSIVAESFPHLRRGAMKDFLDIMARHNYFKDARWDKTNSIYTFETGSKIEFFSVDQPSKVRGARRDRLFLNEANNVPFMAFEELEVRTKEFIFLDWNPTSEFWYYTDVQGKRDDVEEMTLTYLDNEALDPKIVTSIEQRRNRKGWWAVYGEGKLGEVEGRIYTGWQIIDKIPHEARLAVRGLDFGYVCLSGDTLVDTHGGIKRIDDIKVGDYVLTRKGYRSVLWSGSRGFQKVYDVDFGYGRRIVGTGNHRIFTGDGWKCIEELRNNEIICEKKSSLTVNFIGVIQKGNILNIFFPLVTKSACIGIYLKSILERYRTVFISIILMAIRLTTNLLTSSRFPPAHMVKNIIKQDWVLSQNGNLMKSVQGSVSEKITGMNAGRRVWKQLENASRHAKNVIKIYLQPIFIRNFAGLSAEKEQTQEIVKQNMFVGIVEKLLRHLRTLKEVHVLRNAHIFSRPLTLKREVFDISVEGEHEFFANGVLVHNCDPTALIDIYEYDGGFILDEILFQKGMHNRQIAEMVKALDNPAILIIADSAEPKSIDEIKSYGINMIGAKKGGGSVAQGIDFVQSQKISVTKRSVNIIKSYRNYLWKVDRDGRLINVPEHDFSDCADSIRYGMSYFNVQKSDIKNYTANYRKYIDSGTI